MLNQIKRLAFIQSRAQFSTEPGLAATVQHGLYACPVGQRITVQKRRIKERVFRLYTGYEVIEIAVFNVAARQ